MEGPHGSPQGNRDACDWTVDEVVQYLCHDSFDDWKKPGSCPPRPDPAFLENVIRENDIDGDLLLTEVRQDTLSAEFGIKSFGQRATIFRAIKHLRKSSAKYRELDDQSVAPPPSTSPSFHTPVSTYNPAASSRNEHLFPWPQPSPAPTAPAVVQPSTPPQPSPNPIRLAAEQQETSGNTAGDEITVKPTNAHHQLDLPTRLATRQNETVVVGRDGKKRRKLTLGPAESIQQKHDQDNNDWYLGREKLIAPDVFYKNMESDNDEFAFTQTENVPIGKRLFVKQRMQHYHRQRLRQLPEKNGKKAFALLPYNRDLVQHLEIPQYFTLLSRNEQGKVILTKEDADDWPELDDDTGPFRAMLRKYPPILDDNQEGHEGLPLYGGSDSENGYDSDTWREIEADREQAGQHSEEQSAQNRHLDAADVDATIDSCIRGFIETWNTVHRPHEERRAARIWLRSRKNQTKNRDVNAASTRIADLDYRLNKKLRNKIKANLWSKVDEVRRQCQCLERTVFDREHEKWKVSILKLDKCPPRPSGPTKERKPKERPRALADEESLDSDSSGSGETDEDDFIVPDDDLLGGSGLQLPGSQSDSDDDSIIMPTPRRKAIRDARKQSSRDDNHPHADVPSSSPTPHKKADLHTPRKQKETPRSVRDVEVVDLTMSDDADMDQIQISPAGNEEDKDNSFEVHTPPLNPVKDVAGAETPTVTSDKKKKLNSMDEPERNSTRESSSSTRDQIIIDEVSKMPWSHFEEQQDRKRLLIKLIYCRPREEVEAIRSLFLSISREEWKGRMWDSLKFLSKRGDEIDDLTGENSHYMRMVMWFISFINCERATDKGIKKKSLNKAKDTRGLDRFYPELAGALALGRSQRYGSDTPHKLSLTTPTKKNDDRSQIFIDESDDSFADGDALLESFQRTPHNKRKRPVKQSQEAMDSQRSAQRRVEMQLYQQKRLASKLESMGVENGDPERQAVSFEEPVIYLNPHIGRRVKPHQLNGIQFMWRELIKDEKHQGCLLAHTMGLGKTMQVISLLVTIANAANSSDPDIKSQVPETLRRSCTLVLCPSSLIDNWWEEFLMWIPPDPATQSNLGGLRKVQPTLSLNERLHEIAAWYENGGILLISYDIFRITVLNRATKVRPAPLSEEAHANVRKQLWEGPNIVVADEAHKMKNQTSGLAEACLGFRTKSRIALTGSPLANNLTDYFAMIDWIAPGYLGKFIQFKAKYVEPIEAGLYAESIGVERRQSLKRLQVLKKDLDPKVNRHDITALEDSLPPKVEFVMTIALTDVQKRAYSIYVDALQNGNGQVGNTRVWHWMAILSLLCNHPGCFLDKVMQANNNPQKTQRVLSESDSEALPEPVSEVLSKDVLAELRKLFGTSKGAELESPSLSHRARILNELVNESVRVGDKILVFSHSIPTLDYIERLLIRNGKKYCRLDGKTPVGARQASTKSFNQANSELQVYLISTRAGGLGLNIPGANRVVLFDFQFNPTWEEQAVGRTYRLGQDKPVFVYRFIAGGTFEDVMHNKAVFKTQLSFRVVDKKNPIRWASKNQREYLFIPKDVGQEDLSEFKGKDKVLDKILEKEKYIRKIELTETFQREDNDKLTAEEEKDVQAELEDERLKRNNPVEWARRNSEREKKEAAERAKYSSWANMSQPYASSQPTTMHSHPQRPSVPIQLPPRPYPSPYPALNYRPAAYTQSNPAQAFSATQPTYTNTSKPLPLVHHPLSSTQPSTGPLGAPPQPSSVPVAAPSGEKRHAPASVGGASPSPHNQSLNDNLPSSAAPVAEANNQPNGDSVHRADENHAQNGGSPQNDKPIDDVSNEQQQKKQFEDTDVEMADADKPDSPPAKKSGTSSSCAQQ